MSLREHLIPLWKCGPPPSLTYVLDGYIPDGFVSTLYGDGSVGKSWFALALALHVVTGAPFLDRAVGAGPAVFIDAEMSQDELHRRAVKLARGMGLERIPEGIYYFGVETCLTSSDGLKELQRQLDDVAPRLIVVDSATAASVGADPNAAHEMAPFMKRLGSLGTTLLIDHVPKTMFPAPQKAFGSVFKFNLARSAMMLTSNRGVLQLRHTKANLGPLQPPLSFRLEVDSEIARVVTVPFASGQEHDANGRGFDRIADFVRQKGRTSVAEIADALAISRKTVTNRLSQIKTLVRRNGEECKWVGIDLDDDDAAEVFEPSDE